MSNTSHPQHLPDLTNGGEECLRQKLLGLHVSDQAGGYVPLDEEGVNDIMAVVAAHQTAQTDPFDFVQPCKPDCSPERHAYHQGQWDMATRMQAQPTNTIPGEE